MTYAATDCTNSMVSTFVNLLGAIHNTQYYYAASVVSEGTNTSYWQWIKLKWESKQTLSSALLSAFFNSCKSVLQHFFGQRPWDLPKAFAYTFTSNFSTAGCQTSEQSYKFLYERSFMHKAWSRKEFCRRIDKMPEHVMNRLSTQKQRMKKMKDNWIHGLFNYFNKDIESKLLISRLDKITRTLPSVNRPTAVN